MPIDISARFDFILPEPTDCLLQFEAAPLPEQALLETDTWLSSTEHFARVPAQDGIGERIWVRASGRFHIDYSARVEVRRQLADIAALAQLDPHLLPGETVEYLMSSTYCPVDRLYPFTEGEFAGTAGGQRIAAIRDWIARHFKYEPGSTSRTTAIDSFVERRGVCRDYAHVLVTLARASAIPARYVSVYAPGVDPQDFHAVAEVFLADPSGAPGSGAGTWQPVDATGMADPAEMVKIGVGRDAADVSFLTCFSPCDFGDKEITVTRSDG
ncbi:MAG: transglutaminase family protein [Candidatus Andeanibacterium colombiense]|uniref:Transglutaminase family protein n=1 Tax=Candidatus Andeanibacterium colombiense TaxID=3121345 RepID=A0AAJ6BNJ2_9SPHN|nr:MAG: transglutaminase family protein [Sphingomonadaceae bacterium]